MLTEMIKREAIRLKLKYQTSDPYEICRSMRIRVMERPMGLSEKSCKGFFLINARCKVIMLNSDLSDDIKRIIVAHELGHACLHQSEALSQFHEVSVFDSTNRMEYEANQFAAEFLIPDDDLDEFMSSEFSFYQAASVLRVPPELLDFKLRNLQSEGHDVTAPFFAHGDFLKRDISKPLN